MLKRKEDTHIFILLTIILVVIAVLLYLSTLNSITNRTIPTPTGVVENQTNKEYTSDALHLLINYPTNLSLEEEYTDIIFTRNMEKIILSRIATNFDNVESYIEDLSIKNHFTLTNKTEVSKNNLDILKGEIDGGKFYFIYIDGWVYTLSTSSPELYGDLDKIAQSFHYIP